MKTNRKSRMGEVKYRLSDIRKIISQLDKKIEEEINYYVSQIEKTYQNWK